MRVIHKYPLEIGYNRIGVAGVNFKPLAVQLQRGAITLWGELEPSDPGSRHVIQVFGTGWDIPDGFTYIGTVQLNDGTVWHVYWECGV
jgi:hypothetical protein